MWLVGVVVRRYNRYPHNNYYFPYSTCMSSFLAAASLFLCSFLKCFFVFVCYIFFCNIANVAQRTFEIVQKSRSREHGDIIISTRTYVVSRDLTSTCEVLRDVSRKLQLTLCAIMAS